MDYTAAKFSFSCNATDATVKATINQTRNKLHEQYQADHPYAPIFGDTSEHSLESKKTVATRRLARLYQDPNFGPNFFVKHAKILRHILARYKQHKSHPEVYGDMSFLATNEKAGIIYHINSVSKKKEIFVIADESPDGEPLRLNIRQIMKWYKVQRIKSIIIRLKYLKEIEELLERQSQVVDLLESACGNFTSVFGAFGTFFYQFVNFVEEYPLFRSSDEVKKIVDEIVKVVKVLNMTGITDGFAKVREIRGTHEKKEYLKQSTDILEGMVKTFNSLRNDLVDSLGKLLVDFEKLKTKASAQRRYNLRSAT